MKKKPLITAWSFSRLKTYETCPRQFKFKVIDKIPEPSSPAMQRGGDIHKLLEGYVRRDTRQLPRDVKKALGPLFDDVVDFRKARADVELEIALTSKWKQTGWFDRDAWLRVKVDVRHPIEDHIVRMVDYKTGRERPDEHSRQLELYGIAEFALHPETEEMWAEAFYVDHGRKTVAVYPSRARMTAVRKAWGDKAARMLNDVKMNPRPGSACRWCAYSRTKGGPCDAG